MTYEKIFILLFAGSLPLAVLVALGRHVLSAFRSIRNRKYKYAKFSALVILGLPLLFVFLVILMFDASTGPRGSTGGVVFLALVIYCTSFGAWQLARHFDLKSNNHTSR